MLAEAASRPFAIHATAVAIGNRALLVRGASRAGKSRLALALIARSTCEQPVCLIGDDRILLHPVADGFVARPHPRIAGFIERRGLGLVAMPWVGEAPVGAIVDLRQRGGADANPRQVCPNPFRKSSGARFVLYDARWDAGIPTLVLACSDELQRAERVLVWWAELIAAWAQHPPEKVAGALLVCAKD